MADASRALKREIEMEFNREIQDALLAPFPEDEVEFLPRASTNGRALALPYIDARSVMRRLDAVVGPGNWSFDFEVLTPDCKRVKGKLTVLGITKCDAGEAMAEEEALKAAVSDAVKRCAVHFGIGRYLYYLPQVWANFDSQKRRFSEPVRIPHEAVEKALAICGYHGGMPEPARPTTLRVAHGNGNGGGGNGSGGTGGNGSRAAEPVKVAEPAPDFEVTPAPKPRPRPTPVVERRPEPVRAASEPEAAPQAAGTYACSGPSCGRALTKGQYEISLRAFGRPLCPACQKTQTGVRSPLGAQAA